MRGNTIALCLNWLLGVALQGLRGVAPKTITILLAIRQSIPIWLISPRAPWLLSVTESFALPSEPKGGHMPDFEFGLREWIALKVLTPVFLLLLVAAAMFIQW